MRKAAEQSTFTDGVWQAYEREAAALTGARAAITQRKGLTLEGGGYDDDINFVSRSGGYFGSYGSIIDWSRCGPFWQNTAWMAGVRWLMDNLGQAPPQVMERQPDRKFKLAKDQRTADLMLWGNGRDSWQSVLVRMIVFSLKDGGTNGGNAFIGIDEGGNGQPAGLWWIPHYAMTPISNAQNSNDPIERNRVDQWRLTVSNGQYKFYDPKNVIHIRLGSHPEDTRLGMSETRALAEDLMTLDAAAVYGASILKNNGAVDGIASPKPLTPEQTQYYPDFDPKKFAKDFQDMHGARNAGRLLVLDVPVEMQYPKNSPQDLALETSPDRPEANTCALVGVHPQVCNLHVGRLSKTFANAKEAREATWEETCIPMLNLIASAFSRQLLPRVQGGEEDITAPVYAPSKFVVEFDISEIRPLQPDKDLLHKRVDADFMAKIIDRYEARAETGREARPEDRDVWYTAGRWTMNEDISPIGTTTPGRAEDAPVDAGSGGAAAGGDAGGKSGNGNGHHDGCEEPLTVKQIVGPMAADEVVEEPTDWVGRVSKELEAIGE